MSLPLGFVPPCLPTKAPEPPSGQTWLHEIKHDGFPRHRPQGEQARSALQPPRQRRNLALIRRGWLEYPLTDPRQFDILQFGPG
jgi:hypothetical protein